MVRDIMRDEIFLAQKAEPATADDLSVAQDLLDTLAANQSRCVGMAANMIGVNKRIIAFDNEGKYMVMFNPEIVKKSGPYQAEVETMWKCPKCGRTFRNTNQDHYCGEPPKTIEEYINCQPEEIRPILHQLDDAIRTALPDAVRKISWSMPTYWRGHNLIHFAASKKHVGLYPGDEAVAAFADRLEGYSFSKGTIRLPYDKPLPLELVAEIAQWCGAQE